jgi:hypothetical protein
MCDGLLSAALFDRRRVFVASHHSGSISNLYAVKQGDTGESEKRDDRLIGCSHRMEKNVRINCLIINRVISYSRSMELQRSTYV